MLSKHRNITVCIRDPFCPGLQLLACNAGSSPRKKTTSKITVVSEVAPILMVPNGKSSWFANRMPFSLQQVCILVLAGLGDGHLVWAFTVTIAPHYLVDWKAPDNLTTPVKPMECHTCVFASTDNSDLFSPFCFQGTHVRILRIKLFLKSLS